MTTTPKYKNATLLVEKTGMWRLVWYNTNPATGQLERVRKTCDLNRIANLKERRSTATLYIQLINEALKNGYNDFLSPEENAASLGVSLDPLQKKTTLLEPEISVSAAVDKAIKMRCLGMADRTTGTYRSFGRTFTEWLKTNNLETLPVSQFTSEHYQDYLFHKSEQGHGNRNINDHTNFFKTTFEVIRKKMKLIKENPISDIDYLPERESTRFEPLTESEIQLIVPALIVYSPRYYLFTRFIAHEYIRPWHIARLKARDVVYDKDYIKVADETTKNKKSRQKQLLQPIKAMLMEMDYDKLPGNYYLFGRNFEPSEVLYQNLSIRAAEIWKNIVIDGLGIEKKMYALKHTSSQYFVNANENADLKFLQQQMEHHSLTQTEIYLQDKVYKKIDEANVNLLKY